MSLPMTIFPRLPPASTVPAAQPSLRKKSAVIGVLPTSPRNPVGAEVLSHPNRQTTVNSSDLWDKAAHHADIRSTRISAPAGKRQRVIPPGVVEDPVEGRYRTVRQCRLAGPPMDPDPDGDCSPSLSSSTTGESPPGGD